MRKYNSFEEIERDLKKLDLERQIAKEQMISLKYHFQESLSPYNWILTTLEAVKKYGIFFLIKRMFK
ncbi:DUF6327 family protein [Ascidiimonas sp. W6]|uniref:DUF6327 family protein n=1 Tax=Ascidiimonas meishanensis TaxID=3128903 RepID=UPI0030EE216E